MQRPFKSSKRKDVVSTLLAEDAPLDVSEQQQIINGLEQTGKTAEMEISACFSGWHNWHLVLLCSHPATRASISAAVHWRTASGNSSQTSSCCAAGAGVALLMSCCGLLAGLLSRSSFPGSCVPRTGTGYRMLLAAFAATLAGWWYWSRALWQSVQRFRDGEWSTLGTCMAPVWPNSVGCFVLVCRLQHSGNRA